MMTTREDVLKYGLSFPDTYQDAPFHDDIVTDTPTKRIYEAVKKIPKGKVATYGKVAEMAGNSKMSRAVGNVLHVFYVILGYQDSNLERTYHTVEVPKNRYFFFKMTQR